VHGPQDDGLEKGSANFIDAPHNLSTHGHDEGVGKTGHRVCQLNSELFVVVIKPASRDHRDAIGTRDACLSKKTSQQVANYTTDGVRGEDLLLLLFNE
jgi:hypothetical protein